jgi:hypothetical protein
MFEGRLLNLAYRKIMNQIGIENVLVKLNDTVDNQTTTVKTYGLRFITKEGEQREITCRKSTKMPKVEVSDQDKRGQQYYNLKRNGILLLEDINAGHPRSIKAAMIYGFRDYQSPIWLNVFH